MKYYSVEPEVAGGLGPSTILDRSTHPPKVEKLEYKFEGWLGDHIVESFPVFLVTETLLGKMQDAHLTGYLVEDVYVTLSDEFWPLDSTLKLPVFKWIKIVGEAKNSDLFLSSDYKLVISEKAKEIIENVGATHWLLKDYSNYNGLAFSDRK